MSDFIHDLFQTLMWFAALGLIGFLFYTGHPVAGGFAFLIPFTIRFNLSGELKAKAAELYNRTHPQISSASKDVAGKIAPPESLP